MGIADKIIAKGNATAQAATAKEAVAAPRSGGAGIADQIVASGTVNVGRRQDADTFLKTQTQRSDNRQGVSRIGRMQYEAAERMAPIKEAEAQKTLDADFAALQDQKPEEVKDWRNIARLTVSLSAADDDKAKELKDALLWSYGDQLKQHIDAVDSEWWDKNYTEPEEPDLNLLQKGLKFVAPGLEYLGQWGQDALGAVGGVEAALDTNDEVSAGEGLKHAGKSVLSALDATRLPGFGGVLERIPGIGGGKDFDSSVIKTADGALSFDRNADGQLNLREALGKEADASFKVAGVNVLAVADFIGQIALDPTTYATLGASNLAKVGMKGAEEFGSKLAVEGAESIAREIAENSGRKMSRELIEEMNSRIVKGGMKALDDVEQRIYTNVIREMNQDATTKFLGRSLADEQVAAITRGGQAGMRFGGKTVLPTGGRIGEAVKGTTTYGRRVVGGAEETAGIADDVFRASGKVTDGLVDDVVRSVGNGTSRNLLDDARKAMGVADDNLANRETRRLLGVANGDAQVARLTDDLVKQISELPKEMFREPADFLANERQLTEVFRNATSKGLAGEVAELPVIRTIVKAIGPWHATTARFGQAVSDQLKGLLSTTRDDPEVGEIMIRMGADMNRNGLMRKSIKEYGTEEEWSRVLNEALSSAEGRATVLAEAGPEMTKMIETLHDVRLRLRQVAIDGGANPEHLRDIDTYIPRVLTDAARNDAQLLQEIRNVNGEDGMKLGADRLSEQFLQGRTVAENLDNLFDTNEEAFRVLTHSGIRSPEQLFENNPVAAFAARTQSAFRNASEVSVLDGVTEIMGDSGIALGFKATADDTSKLTAREVGIGKIREAGGNVAQYRPIKLDDGTMYFVHNDIAAKMEDVRRVFGDPKQVTEFGRMFDKINNIWAASATVQFINPGFHMRNAVGNIFNSFLGGVRDPLVFSRAAKMQGYASDITKAVRESGDDWLTAAERIGVPTETMEILQQARRLGVLSDGRSVDMLREVGGQVESTRAQASRFNPTSANFITTKTGRDVGQAVEGNARLGLFIDQLDKGASPQLAARHVKEYLFDYGDLTRFENESLRRVSRFYTFTRKNTALQAYALSHYPGRVANAQKGVEAAVAGMFGNEDGQDSNLPPWMPGASVANVAGQNVAMQIDTPFNSFKDTVGILLAPQSDDPMTQYQADNYLMGVATRGTTLFSGFAPASIQYLQELETRKDAFSGRRLDPPDTDHARDDPLFRALSLVFPGVSRLEGIGSRAGLTRDGENEQSTVLQAINLLSGIQTYALSEDTDSSARYVLRKEIDDLMSDLRQKGVEVPSIEEMREAGDLQVKNSVVEALMYGWRENEDGTLEWDDSVKDERLLGLVPKNVRDALSAIGAFPTDISTLEIAGPNRGARPDVVEGSEEELAQKDADFKEALTAIETYLGRTLSEQERWTMVSTFGGALSVTDQENAGVDPYRTNRLAPKTETDEAAELARKEQIFNSRLSAVGLSWDQVRAQFPRVSTMEKRLRDARALGWSDEEIKTALYFAADEGGEGWTSRADRAAINQLRTGDRLGGAVPLTTQRMPTTTNEDLEKLQTKVWDASEELRLIYQFEGWGSPSPNELFMYGVNTLTKGEQRLLGIEPLRGAPNRDDQRSDAQKMIDAQSKLGAVNSGLTNGPTRWDPTAQPDLAPWEQLDYTGD